MHEVAFSPRSSLTPLVEAPVRDGKVMWIGVRGTRRAPPTATKTATALAGKGLLGDHYDTRSNGARQVTLIQAEHLEAVASYLGRDAIDPALVRRNIVVSGINLLALKGRRFRIGEALLEYSGTCEPCSRMEQTLGTGGYNAMRGHGGITARIVEGGEVTVGDRVHIVRA